MQETTSGPAHGGTGSATIADIVSLAAERYGERPAARFKRDGEWTEASYAELAETVSEIARGLIDLGLAPGDRVALLCTTRVEWTFADFAITSAGGVVVPIYPTNSPEECAWVAGNSESRFIICEDASQVAKIVAVRSQLPKLEEIVAIEPADGALALDALRERGRARDPQEVADRTAAVKPEDPYTIIYTSGTTGPPKGCVLTQDNYRQVTRMCEEIGIIEAGELVYLFLPLAHSYALLIQLLCVDLGAPLIYWSGDPNQIVPDLMATKPAYLPSVPRIFEKIYTLVTSNNDPEMIKGATQLGLTVRRMQAAGQPVPEQLQAAFDKADAELFSNVRNIFGGNLKQATSGAAPIGREILEFFFACGAPVLEGYGMTETSTVTTTSTVADHKLGTVGRALPGAEVKIADDGEILDPRPAHLPGLLRQRRHDRVRRRAGRLAAHRRPRLARRGRLPQHHRPQEGHHDHGGRQEPHAGQPGERPQALALDLPGRHARRPPPVPGRADHPRPGGDRPLRARRTRLSEDVAALHRDPKVIELIQGVLDGVNENYARVEQIKRFFILDHDLSQETGELTPTLKVKRNVVNELYAEDFEKLYAS